MFWKRVVVIVLCAAVSPTAVALAQEQPPLPEARPTMAALPPIGPLRAAIERVRFERAPDLRTDPSIGSQSSTTETSGKGSVVGRIVMAGVLGVGGFLGGGYLGAKIEGPCDCDDPGLKGALIGAPIGATIGAIAGWKLGGFLNR